MKKITVVLCLLSTVAFSQDIAEVKIKTSAICGMCKERIERTLSLSKGIKEATLNLDDSMVKVVYKTNRTSSEAIRQIISNTGYDADSLKANMNAHDALPSCCQKGTQKHKE